MRKVLGPDGTSGWTLREDAQEVAEELYGIIENSLKEEGVRRDWKTVNINQIYESGDKEDHVNCVPFSLTSVT